VSIKGSPIPTTPTFFQPLFRTSSIVRSTMLDTLSSGRALDLFLDSMQACSPRLPERTASDIMLVEGFR